MRPAHGTHWVRRSTRFAIYVRDGWTCVYCLVKGKPETFGAGLTLDHLQPWNRQGNNDSPNLVTCCVQCNTHRQDEPLVAFLIRFGDQIEAIKERIEKQRWLPLNVVAGREIAKAEVEAGPDERRRLRGGRRYEVKGRFR